MDSTNNTESEALRLHREWAGKLEIKSRVSLNNKRDLALAYTPGVAEPCLEIAKDPALSYVYTRRWNTVAVITDGTAVLGLGDIGPEAGMPVMEGKCLLFKEFAGIDAIPLCVRSKNADEIVNTVAMLAGSFGGINLEDIAAPRCFEIERRLKERCDIPVFHDDQHGTAVVVAAALLNSMKLLGKALGNITVVINGAGSAGIAITRLLLRLGVGEIILCDRNGIISRETSGDNPAWREIAETVNPGGRNGVLADAMRGADMFIGVSGPRCVNGDMIRSMANNPVVFAMANPSPEIMPEEALAAGATIVGTGRSDYPNQINNLLAFPGIFRGALDARASDINETMKLAAARAIAELAGEALSEKQILPDPLEKGVAYAVGKAVAAAAVESGAAVAKPRE